MFVYCGYALQLRVRGQIISLSPSVDRDWTREGLISKYGNILFKIGRVQNKLVDYFKYSDESLEDTPLYLFVRPLGSLFWPYLA
jgi:hypothetical protein